VPSGAPFRRLFGELARNVVSRAEDRQIRRLAVNKETAVVDWDAEEVAARSQPD